MTLTVLKIFSSDSMLIFMLPSLASPVFLETSKYMMLPGVTSVICIHSSSLVTTTLELERKRRSDLPPSPSMLTESLAVSMKGSADWETVTLNVSLSWMKNTFPSLSSGWSFASAFTVTFSGPSDEFISVEIQLFSLITVHGR